MADRVLRGSRLGAVSYETDRNHDLAPRQLARYRTENGEEFEVPFADDAEIPGTWLCRNGLEGTLIEGELPEPKKVKPHVEVAKSDWDRADYYGDGNNGGYVNVARKGRSGGWYLTVSIDSDTGGFTETISQDDGPYKSEARARLAGSDAVREWLRDNKVRGDRAQNARVAKLIQQVAKEK